MARKVTAKSYSAIHFDASQFKAAVAQYAAACGKDFAYCIQLKMRDAFFKAGMKAKKASSAAIMRVARAPKYVAWSLRRSDKHQTYEKTYSYLRRRSRPAKDGTIHTLPAHAEKSRRMVHYEKQDAYDMAWAIKQRTKRIGFISALYTNAALWIHEHCHLPGSCRTRKSMRSGYNVQFKKPDPDEPSGTCVVTYRYRFYTWQNGAHEANMQRRLAEWMSQGMAASAADMQRYIERKMSERAREVSIR